MMQNAFKRLAEDDSGISIIELVAASVIGLLVLSVSYLVLETAMKGFRSVENETIASRAAATSVQRMSRGLREGSQFSIAGDYEVQFTADYDDDGELERLRYYIPAGSYSLMADIANGDGSSTRTIEISGNMRNRQANAPLFSYYSAVDAPISNAASRTTDVQIVRVTAVTSANTTPAAALFRLQTDLFLRNE